MLRVKSLFWVRGGFGVGAQVDPLVVFVGVANELGWG